MRRVATGFVALLVGLTTVAGVVAADARRDHDRAPVTITAVQQPEGTSFASYEPGSWGPKPVHQLIAPHAWRLPFERAWRNPNKTGS